MKKAQPHGLKLSRFLLGPKTGQGAPQPRPSTTQMCVSQPQSPSVHLRTLGIGVTRFHSLIRGICLQSEESKQRPMVEQCSKLQRLQVEHSMHRLGRSGATQKSAALRSIWLVYGLWLAIAPGATSCGTHDGRSCDSTFSIDGQGFDSCTDSLLKVEVEESHVQV